MHEEAKMHGLAGSRLSARLTGRCFFLPIHANARGKASEAEREGERESWTERKSGSVFTGENERRTLGVTPQSLCAYLRSFCVSSVRGEMIGEREREKGEPG